MYRRIISDEQKKIPVAMREHMAENMKERVYASITLIAVITALWQTAEHHSAIGAIASIVGTSAGLWLATLIAARVSYRAIYSKGMSGSELARLLFASSGLFAPAVIPVCMILISMTGALPLKDAFLSGMVVLILSLFVLSFSASRKIYASKYRAVGISLLEMSVGVGVILLKLAIGK